MVAFKIHPTTSPIYMGPKTTILSQNLYSYSDPLVNFIIIQQVTGLISINNIPIGKILTLHNQTPNNIIIKLNQGNEIILDKNAFLNIVITGSSEKNNNFVKLS